MTLTVDIDLPRRIGQPPTAQSGRSSIGYVDWVVKQSGQPLTMPAREGLKGC